MHRRREGLAPSPFRPSYRAPPLIRYERNRASAAPSVFVGQRGFQSPSAPWCLATPSAPAVAAAWQSYVFTPSRRGDLHPLSDTQPWRFLPLQDPFRVAQPANPGFLRVFGAGSKGWLYHPSALLSAAPARISPGTRLPRRGRGSGGSLYPVRPRHHPGWVCP